MSKNEIEIVKQAGLKVPGDSIIAYITKTGRQVVKVKTKESGNYSATRYPTTGTIHETKTTKWQ